MRKRVIRPGLALGHVIWWGAAVSSALGAVLSGVPADSAEVAEPFDETGAIVFASERDASSTDVYLVSAKGDSVYRVTNHDRSERLVAPRWMRPGAPEIFGFFPVKSSNDSVTAFEASGFSLSVTSAVHTRNHPKEDGRRSLSHTIPAVDAFHVREEDGLHIYVTERGTADTTRIQANGFHPVWSPDSQTMAFLSGRFGAVEIFSMNREGGDVVRLAPGVAAHRPVWSWPHGHRAIDSGEARSLAFLGGDPDGPMDLYVVNRDGSRLMNVSQDPGRVDAFCWSWDGRQVAFSSYRDGNREIYVVNTDGSGLRNVTNHAADDLQFGWIALSTTRSLFDAAAATEEQLRAGIDPTKYPIDVD